MVSIPNTKQGGFEIRHNVVNFSTAQQRYAFSKEPRFQYFSKTKTDFTAILGSTFSKRNSPCFGIGDRFRGFTSNAGCKFSCFLYSVYFCIVETPSPGTYHFKSTVGERQPTIVGNALTTSFKNQAARSAFDKVYVPGARSAKGYEYIPGPGAYMLRNK